MVVRQFDESNAASLHLIHLLVKRECPMQRLDDHPTVTVTPQIQFTFCAAVNRLRAVQQCRCHVGQRFLTPGLDCCLDPRRLRSDGAILSTDWDKIWTPEARHG